MYGSCTRTPLPLESNGKTGAMSADKTQVDKEAVSADMTVMSAAKELLENSRILTKKLEEEAADIKKLKEEYYTLRFKLSDLQTGRAVIARMICDTKILLEKIPSLTETPPVWNSKP
ncbi:hypothetical protein C0J52_00714 [Blattella germanica]|nr:hypothetical protein C0J52_00714 [Blattella germanica]